MLQKYRTQLTILSLFFAVTAGCTKKVLPPTIVKPHPEATIITRTGYTIQVGAFRNLNNAERLATTLNEYNLKAYYFTHKSGLFKVRFGDYYSKNKAQNQAEKIQAAGIIKEFFIVSPESYAVEKAPAFGIDYLREEIVGRAKSYIGLPYQWGGSSPEKGFDCSGLTKSVYQLVGLNLPRTSVEQFEAGKPVNKKTPNAGDLVFFRTSNSGKVSHVGIYSGNQKFIHAPGKNKKIREDSLNNSYFLSRYAGARAYLN